MRIDRFEGPYDYLSNFYEAPVLFEGLHYRSSEAAYQASKSVHPGVRAYFTGLSPDDAKKLGRSIIIRPDWAAVREDVMRRVVHAKFTQNPALALKLIQTGDAELEEGNCWHDNFFGNCRCPNCAAIPGKNMLGKILMDERGRLRCSIQKH